MMMTSFFMDVDGADAVQNFVFTPQARATHQPRAASKATNADDTAERDAGDAANSGQRTAAADGRGRGRRIPRMRRPLVSIFGRRKDMRIVR